MRSVLVDGPAPRTTRRWAWCRLRELACVHGHRLKLQPFLLAHTGLSCTHRDPPGLIPPCGACGLYVPYPAPRRALVIACTPDELAHLLEAGLGLNAACAYLDVGLPVGLALTA